MSRGRSLNELRAGLATIITLMKTEMESEAPAYADDIEKLKGAWSTIHFGGHNGTVALDAV